MSGATADRQSIQSGAAHWGRRAGLYLNRARRSIWFHGDAVGDFESVVGLIRRLRSEVSTDRFIFTSPRAASCAWLRQRYPNDNALPVPIDLGPLFDRFLRQLNPILLLWIQDAPGLSMRALQKIRDRGIVVLPIATSSAPLPADGEAADRVSSPTSEGLEAVLAHLPRAPMPDPTAPRRMAQMAETRLGRWVISTRDRGPIADWTALGDRLGRPRSILCLGNGPSSEDPPPEGVTHDCLFRVNWRWRSRGLHLRPDMVFVGDTRTPRELHSCVFGFRDVAWEREMLLRQLVLGLSLETLEYFTLERVPSPLNAAGWPAHPSNGAVMVATAAGLQPERLIVAGIDLYRDPRGRYPWDSFADNALPQMHDAYVEAEVIGSALDDYRGEVIILSDQLRRALERRRNERSRGPARP